MLYKKNTYYCFRLKILKLNILAARINDNNKILCEVSCILGTHERDTYLNLVENDPALKPLKQLFLLFKYATIHYIISISTIGNTNISVFSPNIDKNI
jgi:hypothetical protein